MATIVTRIGKGSALTWTEMDENLTNLNKDKLESANPTTSGTLTHSGDIRLSGSGQRITGDFSNTTVINRVLFQTSTANSGTVVGVIPTTTGQYTGFQAYNTATPGSGNNAILDIGVVDGTDCRIQASYEASGPVLPLTFYTGGTERFRVSTSGAIGLSGGNYGTSGQVLTSQGSGTPPIWSTVAGGGVTSVNGNTGAVTAAQVAAAATAGYGYTPAGANRNFDWDLVWSGAPQSLNAYANWGSGVYAYSASSISNGTVCAINSGGTGIPGQQFGGTWYLWKLKKLA